MIRLVCKMEYKNSTLYVNVILFGTLYSFELNCLLLNCFVLVHSL